MDSLDKIVLDKFKILLSSRLNWRRMVLFGSRARGDADQYSDMDVVVILDDPITRETRDFISDCAWEAGYRHGIVIVPVVFSEEEWENGPERHSLLVKAVEAEGVNV